MQIIIQSIIIVMSMLIILLAPTAITAQDTQTQQEEATEENSEKKKLSTMALPVAAYSTDTGVVIGAAGIHTYNQQRFRPSNILGNVMYTQKKQITVTAVVNHYFPGRGNRIYAGVQYYLYPTDYYGMGNDTSAEDPEKYTPEYEKAEIYYEYKLQNHYSIKTGMILYNYVMIDAPDSSRLKSDAPPHYMGRFDAGPEFGFLRDSRDRQIVPNRGSLVQVITRTNPIRNKGDLFVDVEFDTRKYFNPAEYLVIASQILVNSTFGDRPFYAYPTLGGTDRHRGYAAMRFIGRNLLLVQQDIRFPIWRWFGGAVFASTGAVAPEFGTLFSQRFHNAAGAGLRIFINREDEIMIRMDYARGTDSSGFYVGFGEAF